MPAASSSTDAWKKHSQTWLSVLLPALDELDASVESFTALLFLSCSWVDAHSGKHHAEFWLLKHTVKWVWKAQATVWLFPWQCPAGFSRLAGVIHGPSSWPPKQQCPFAQGPCSPAALLAPAWCSRECGLLLYWLHSWGTAD